MAREAISAYDRKWAAESDVRTLTEAEAIKKTPSRLNAAKVAAKRMVKEQQQTVEAINKVASGSSKEAKTKRPASKVKEKSKVKSTPAPGKIDPVAMVKM